MSLKQIKFTGFKSFVDQTSVPFQTNLTAIVGPNGCGKSNIIDGVRWVLGEISAKQMRGNLMSDVIFNGSTKRKPLGQAAVELIFDNSAALIGGEYAKYNEIAIRREVNREGVSDYYLNGANCRRKDIIDLFLGTGLGLHSYAVIEQGMISQLIEAKPEELRLHLEEAAGISKYKERRRETENRISHTKENLLRLNDIRTEIESQLKILKRQSNAAAIYKKFREEERLIKATLQALYWRDLDVEAAKQQQSIQSSEVYLAEKLAAQRKAEAILEELHQKQIELTELFNEAQNRFYRFDASITQLEQKIHYNKERKTQLTNDLTKLEQTCQDVLQHKTTDIEQIGLLNAEIEKLQSEIEVANQVRQDAQQALLSAEASLEEWQRNWDEFNLTAAKAAQQVEVAETRFLHLQQAVTMETELLAKLMQETQGLDFANLNQEISSLNTKDADFSVQGEELKQALIALQQKIIERRADNQNLANELNQVRGNLQTLLGKQSALTALQDDALGGSKHEVKGWLQKNNFLERSRLAKELKVAAGWERAVEVVLGDYLEAVCVDDLEKVLTDLSTLQNVPGNDITFLTRGSGSLVAVRQLLPETLANKVTSTYMVSDILSPVYAAENLAEALKVRPNLAENESVITRDGVWLSTNWLRVALQANSKGGVLQRENELQELATRIGKEQNLIRELEQKLESKQKELSMLERDQDLLQQKFHDLTDHKGEVSSALSAKQAHLDHLTLRAQNLKQEMATHKDALFNAQNQLTAIEKSLKENTLLKEQSEKQRSVLLQTRDQYREKFNAAKEFAEAQKESVRVLEKRKELLENQIIYLQQSLQRALQQLLSLDERRLELKKALTEVSDPMPALMIELEEKLGQRIILEKELASARDNVTGAENKSHEIEKVRAQAFDATEQIRKELEQLRIVMQGLEVKRANHIAQIEEFGFKIEAILTKISAELEQGQLNQEILTEKLARIMKRIDRLGPINLAAIDEYNQKKERKDYLDSQNNDLLVALSTLEEAILKINRETKTKLQSIFDKVNANFQYLFPKVFGGGKASLQMIGDDVLECGMAIWAQPPGKRNSSIHLLSGGEKALTAISLIFAIFQINPAPFCLLDEVDAPFDDENAGRFCQLVKEMSNSVQFVYVSHNKISMQMANHLLGVTMQEPGVSRIVSVDIDQALDMAEA